MNGGITLRRFVTPAFRIRASTIRGALIRGALPALAGALVLAGCGGGSGNAAGTSAAGASASATAPAGAERLRDMPEAARRNGQAGAVQRPAARVLLTRRLPDRVAAPARVHRRPEFGRVQGLR